MNSSSKVAETPMNSSSPSPVHSKVPETPMNGSSKVPETPMNSSICIIGHIKHI